MITIVNVDVMKTKLEQVLEKKLLGRQIAIWGSPTRSLLRVIATYDFCSASNVDVNKHYVVAVNDNDLDDFLIDEQSKTFKYVEDYISFSDLGGELPFEWKCADVKIGRQTYFSDGVVEACLDGYIESIGHFTSINNTVEISVDHQHNMTFVSDDIKLFFNEENKKAFDNKCLDDEKHPYATGKKPLTIGNDVWIGAHVFINCSKVSSIGDGAIIGAGAIVLEDVPPYAVVLGVPASIKKYRYSKEMIDTLLQVKWWDWSNEEINKNIDALLSPEIFLTKFKNK